MNSLYIHIPFCNYICTYCDFCKKHNHSYNEDIYIDYLIKELDLIKPKDIDSIYIGGGTPSCINLRALKKLLSYLYSFKDLKEYTIEMNPDDINEELLILLKEYNVSRISLGIQSLSNKVLKQINRQYTKEEVYLKYNLLQKYFDNISCDFMFNLPDQDMNDIDQIISFIKENNLKHFSFYDLILEQNTVLNNKNYKGLSDEETSNIYSYIQEQFKEYNQYEISNYANPGYESYHNIGYWTNKPYYGVGLSSSSLLNNTRFTNTRSIKDYYDALDLNKIPFIEKEVLSKEDLDEEKIILSLRYNNFISVSDKIINIIKELNYESYFIIKDNEIKLKPSSYYISNIIIVDILLGMEKDENSN
ncbi:MAG: radical SAM family heme chaperone HemW [Mycoplasmatales bacterium]